MISKIRALLLLLPLTMVGCSHSFDAASSLDDQNIVVTAHFNDDFTAIYQGLLGVKTKSLDISSWNINTEVAAALAKSLTAQGYRATSGVVIKPGDKHLKIVPATYPDYIWNKNQELSGIGVYRLFEMVDEHVIAFTSYKIIVMQGNLEVGTLYGQFKLNMGTERWDNEKYWENPSTAFPAGVESLYRQVVVKHFEKLYPSSLPTRPPSLRKRRK